MMNGLQSDLREAGEALLKGYSRSSAEELTLAETIGGAGALGVLAAGTVATAKKFIEAPSKKAALVPTVLLGGVILSAMRLREDLHEFAHVVRNQ